VECNFHLETSDFAYCEFGWFFDQLFCEQHVQEPGCSRPAYKGGMYVLVVSYLQDGDISLLGPWICRNFFPSNSRNARCVQSNNSLGFHFPDSGSFI
jgi:hypothetical protein